MNQPLNKLRIKIRCADSPERKSTDCYRFMHFKVMIAWSWLKWMWTWRRVSFWHKFEKHSLASSHKAALEGSCSGAPSRWCRSSGSSLYLGQHLINWTKINWVLYLVFGICVISCVNRCDQVCQQTHTKDTGGKLTPRETEGRPNGFILMTK